MLKHGSFYTTQSGVDPWLSMVDPTPIIVFWITCKSVFPPKMDPVIVKQTQYFIKYHSAKQNNHLFEQLKKIGESNIIVIDQFISETL